MTTIGIVACSKTKLATAAPARQLYTSPLFKAAADYCERTYDRWLIISARYGLIEPDQVIEPYDLTLRQMRPRERLTWIRLVFESRHSREVMDLSRAGGQVYLHVGRLYVTPFAATSYRLPLQGLGIGQQLAWYAARRPSISGVGR